MTVAASMKDGWFYTYDAFLGRPHPFPIAFALGSSFFYLLMIYVVVPLFKPSPAGFPAVERVRFFHNVLLCLFSTACTVVCLWYLIVNGEASFLWYGDNKPMMCQRADPWLYNLGLVFTVSKAYEWFDTVFLVLVGSKGATNFLHVYHHATTFWIFLIVQNLPGPMKLGLLLNGGVHALMYAHYAWPFPKKWVPLITISQIAQLIYVTYIWTITPSSCPPMASFPQEYFYEFITPYFFVPVYIVFFIHFFVKRFLLGGGKKGGSGGAPRRAVPSASAVHDGVKKQATQ